MITDCINKYKNSSSGVIMWMRLARVLKKIVGLILLPGSKQN